MWCVCLLLAGLVSTCLSAADTLGVAVTNHLYVSQVERTLGWRRQPVLANPDGSVVDASGVLVSSAEVSSLDYVVSNVSDIALAASAGMSNAVSALVSATNAVPPRALHYALHLAPLARANLYGVVVREGSDGTNDWQDVYYSRPLLFAPRRFVSYVPPGVTNNVEVVWDQWSAFGADNDGVHRCTVARPRPLWGLPCQTSPVERFGGSLGFSFGAFEVSVDGVLAWTGEVTNRVSGEVWVFEKGVLCD